MAIVMNVKQPHMGPITRWHEAMYTDFMLSFYSVLTTKQHYKVVSSQIFTIELDL